MMEIIKFLKELRDSSERIYSIYSKGSCYRLCVILKTIYPTAEAYWSDQDNHAITKIDDKYYDIGGEIAKEYVEENGYFLILDKFKKGYYLLKYIEDESLRISARINKYI